MFFNLKKKIFLVTWQYCPPEVKILIKEKKNDSEFKISSEKSDIFALAVTVLCLLNYDVVAD
jgi:serine/threonine protein kinase